MCGVKKTDNVPSCTWTHDVQLQIAGTNERKSAQQVKQGAE